MGVPNGRILLMVLVQGLVVGAVGYCLGVGLACLFGVVTRDTQLSFFMPWQVPLITAAAVAVIVALASLRSMRTASDSEPATGI